MTKIVSKRALIITVFSRRGCHVGGVHMCPRNGHMQTPTVLSNCLVIVDHCGTGQMVFTLRFLDLVTPQTSLREPKYRISEKSGKSAQKVRQITSQTTQRCHEVENWSVDLSNYCPHVQSGYPNKIFTSTSGPCFHLGPRSDGNEVLGLAIYITDLTT